MPFICQRRLFGDLGYYCSLVQTKFKGTGCSHFTTVLLFFWFLVPALCDSGQRKREETKDAEIILLFITHAFQPGTREKVPISGLFSPYDTKLFWVPLFKRMEQNRSRFKNKTKRSVKQFYTYMLCRGLITHRGTYRYKWLKDWTTRKQTDPSHHFSNRGATWQPPTLFQPDPGKRSPSSESPAA